MKQTDFYQDIERFSLLNAYYAYMDTDAYLADQLFIKHQVRVHFREEYARDGSPYRVIFCHVRKRDQERFLAALNAAFAVMLIWNRGSVFSVRETTLPVFHMFS